MIEPAKVLGIRLVAGGGLYAVGGMLHPRGSGDTKDAYIASMLSQNSWAGSHLASCAGLVLIAVTLIATARTSTFGLAGRTWIWAAAAGAGLGAAELLPHTAAASDLSHLEHGDSTPILDTHLLLQTVATPALGLTTAALAVYVARQSQTGPARALAAIAVLCGVAYAFAGPLTAISEGVRFVVLFPASAGIALWYLGTGIRLLTRHTAPAAPTAPAMEAVR